MTEAVPAPLCRKLVVERCDENNPWTATAANEKIATNAITLGQQSSNLLEKER